MATQRVYIASSNVQVEFRDQNLKWKMKYMYSNIKKFSLLGHNNIPQQILGNIPDLVDHRLLH